MICVNCGHADREAELDDDVCESDEIDRAGSLRVCPACGNDVSSAVIDSDTIVSSASAERRRIAWATEAIGDALYRIADALERANRIAKGGAER